MAAFDPFAKNLNDIADVLEVLRRRVCAYTTPIDKEAVRCDCKYGLTEDGRNGGEQTGCPELRYAISVLRQTNTKDLDAVLRNNRILVGALKQVADEAARVAKDFG